MYDLMTMRVVASDRRAGAQRAADQHRQRVALRADTRSVLAATLQRLVMRLDARACQATEGSAGADPTGDAFAVSTGGAFAARNELRSAA